MRYCAKYLGVYIGNGFEKMIWEKPVEKFRVRVQGVSALVGAWNSQVLSYKAFAVSVLSYIMQFATLPKKLLQDESAMIAKVMKTPRNAITNIAAYHLDLFHLPPLPDLASLGRASMARAWLSLRSSSFVESIVDEASDSFESLFVDPIASWYQHSIVHTMAANYRSVHNLPGLQLFGHKSPQAALYLALRGPTPN